MEELRVTLCGNPLCAASVAQARPVMSRPIAPLKHRLEPTHTAKRSPLTSLLGEP